MKKEIKKLNKTCAKCDRKINDKDNYLYFQEFKNNKLIWKGFIHKQCFVDYESSQKALKQANILLDGLGYNLKQMGLLQPKEKEYVVA